MKVAKPNYKFDPDYGVRPGEILAEVLEEHEMAQADLARRTGLSTKHINQIVTGDASISPETAQKLEIVTRVPARLWTRLEADHQQYLSRQAEETRLEADVGWLDELPVKELIDRGAIARQPRRIDQLREVLSFFGVASRDAWATIWDVPTAFRASPSFKSDMRAVAAWLRIGELEAGELDCEPFDRGGLRKALPEMRALTQVNDPKIWMPELQQLCSEFGVALVIEPEIAKARINGAVRWLSKDLVLVELSLRHRWTDIVWFTFFHEIGHILLHERKRLTFVDEDSSKGDTLEEEADAFASRTLIPNEYLDDLSDLGTPATIRRFADRIGISPGIVVGRLQHDGVLGYHQCNQLRQRLVFKART
jgi:HTH-type transcriptional regulator/antitoxin HigA